MFYSHEVLTSRKYGVATIWLVATLGSKSGLKKVSRKAILDVDVQKACETIVTPYAPMALRLQSNLLYGVTRVYSQQCGYVLTDAETAKTNMRTMFQAMRTSALEAEGATKGRAENLVLQDDPNFMPNFDLMTLDLDQLDLEAPMLESPQSFLSLDSSQRTLGSQQMIGGLEIPGFSASSMVGGPVGGYMSGFSVRGDSGAGRRYELGTILEHDDLGLDLGDIDIAADGTMRLSSVAARHSSVFDGTGPRAGRDAGRVHEEYEMRGAAHIDDQAPIYDGDDFVHDLQTTNAQVDPEQSLHQSTTSETIDAAPLRAQRSRPIAKVIGLDADTQLHSRDLARWNTDYVANMREALRQKHTTRLAVLAKKNAAFWVLGADDQGDMLPLDMFTGARLLDVLTGSKTAGEKRSSSGAEEEAASRRVRARSEQLPSEVGRGDYEDGFEMNVEDEIEQGRDAPTPLNNRLSNLLPWNQSTGSRRPTGGFTSSVGGGPGILGPVSRRGSRLVSASPLLGRGTAAYGEVLEFPEHVGDIDMADLEDFQLHGPAAAVDTQTAAQSQWQRNAMNTESNNFLTFVEAGVEEADQARGQDDEQIGSVEFKTLLEPGMNTRIVAAQALMHVLTLATRGLLEVAQERGYDDPIALRLVAVR